MYNKKKGDKQQNFPTTKQKIIKEEDEIHKNSYMRAWLPQNVVYVKQKRQIHNSWSYNCNVVHRRRRRRRQCNLTKYIYIYT